ncbi:hypothetical protein JXQ70_17425 [bacterium]|nr:hypothetical protein [bacterium]
MTDRDKRDNSNVKEPVVFLSFVSLVIIVFICYTSSAFCDWRDTYQSENDDGRPVFDVGYCGCNAYIPTVCEQGQYDPSLCGVKKWYCKATCFHDNQFPDPTPTPAPTSTIYYDEVCKYTGLIKLDGWWGHSLTNLSGIIPGECNAADDTQNVKYTTDSGGYYYRNPRTANGVKSVVKTVIVDPNTLSHNNDMHCKDCFTEGTSDYINCITDVTTSCPDLPTFAPDGNGDDGDGLGVWTVLTFAFDPYYIDDASDVLITIYDQDDNALASKTLNNWYKHEGGCWGCDEMNTKFYFWDIREITEPEIYFQIEWDETNADLRLNGWNVAWIQAHLQQTCYALPSSGGRVTLSHRFTRGDSSWSDGENSNPQKIGLTTSFIIDWGDGNWSFQFANNSDNLSDRNYHDYGSGVATYNGMLYVIYNSIDYAYTNWDIEVWDSKSFVVEVGGLCSK